MEVLDKPLTQEVDTDGPMMSYTSGTSDKPLLGVTIGDMFDRTTARYPDNEALVSRHQNLRYTYKQLQAEIDRFARGLMALGLKKGERIGIWSPNNAEWVITMFAATKIGAILVNVNPAYRLNELEYALRQSGCSAIVIAPAFKTSNYTEMLYNICPELHTAQPGQLHSEKLPSYAPSFG